MLLLGIDIGTSFVKASVIDSATQQCIATAQYPETETEIISLQNGWAEQSPDMWWENVKQAILKCNTSNTYNSLDIAAIGIAYQMHGLVMIDKNQTVLRNSIIWCDSRAVEIGKKAMQDIGEEKCLSHLLNSPGNFTASKLAWVKANEPALYERIDKIMLPGDFIAMKLSGEITTTITALSEGVFWDFKNNELSKVVFDYFGFDEKNVPAIKNVFEKHGVVKDDVAQLLGLSKNATITYKAGDQPNNALSLNVMQPGEVAATAGTSGVIYAVDNSLRFDTQSRVNSFAHINHTAAQNRIGVLLCINGTGILNKWVKNFVGASMSYEAMNHAAAQVNSGSDGLIMYPFGNGAERMLGNSLKGASIENLNLNIHTPGHIFRAAQECIVYAFKYGFDIMSENGIKPKVIRAGKANMFLSNVFAQCFVDVLQVPVELYSNDGSVGAAIGAGLGAGIYSDQKDAFQLIKPNTVIEPNSKDLYLRFYEQWKKGITQ